MGMRFPWARNSQGFAPVDGLPLNYAPEVPGQCDPPYPKALLLHALLFLVFLGPVIPKTPRDLGSYLV